MATIITSTDFTGEYSVSQNPYTDIDVYISKYEKHYLLRLFGAELYDLFVADLVSSPLVPFTDIYKDVFDSFHNDDCGLVVSEGIKQMLVQLIYFHYQREKQYQSTISGIFKAQTENSQNLGSQGANLIDTYNKAVSTARSIQWYIEEHSTVYPKFNGSYFEYMNGI